MFSLRLHTFITLVISIVFLFSSGCGETTPVEISEEGEQEDLNLPDSKQDAAEATNVGKADWSIDICERNSWYGDKVCDWFCPKTDTDCDLDPLGPEPAGEATRFPIVLAHGFMGSDSNFWSFYRLRDALTDDGHDVFEAEVPPFHSVSERAAALAEDIDDVLATTGAEKVNIIAHSMGGLDSRYLISTLGYGDRVASLTTISSPHGGTRIADVYLDLMPEAVDDAADALAELVGGTFSDVADEADMRAAMVDIAESNADTFNEANPDDERVYYQSWAGVSSVDGIRVDGIVEACDYKVLMHDGTMDRMNRLLWPSAALVATWSLTLNDGMVTVENAKWGDFQGCIPADHFDQVGQINHDEMDRHTGFDHLRFYRIIAFDLEAKGF